MNGWIVAVLCVALSACVNLAPRYRQPALPVAAAWPISATGVTAVDATANGVAVTGVAVTGAPADIGWRDFFVDQRLQQLIALALENNRDLRVAMLNVEKVQAQYQVQRAARLPAVNASGGLLRERLPAAQSFTGSPQILQEYSASVGVSAFEVDLFSRVRNLSRAALEQYFAQESARRSAQLSLIAQVASAYLVLAADGELQRLAQQTLQSQEDSFRLSQRQHDLGAVSGLDLAQARTTVEAARADQARYAGNVATDTNALTLLVGTTIEPTLLAEGVDMEVSGLGSLPEQMPSQVLLRRPDILQAEHLLRAADADIGAARAAFFPSITLTGSAGYASSELSGLFDAGNRTWSFTPLITLPIFQGGRLRGNLDAAKASRDIALAQYEGAIQTGFREVADALALTQTLAQQRAAQANLAAATRQSFDLSKLRYQAGRDSYLLELESQRADYAAQQALISTRLAEQVNRATLYKVLGGGWRERSP